MTPPWQILIDLNEAAPGLPPADLEEMAQTFAEEIRSGRLVQTAELLRETEIPEGSMSVLGALTAIVGAVVSPESITSLVGFLLKRFEPEKLYFSWTDGDRGVAFEYTTPEEFDRQIQAAKELSNFSIQVKGNGL